MTPQILNTVTLITFRSPQNVEKRKLMLGVKVVSMLPQKFKVKCPEKALWCFLPVRGPVFLINYVVDQPLLRLPSKLNIS